MTTDGHSRGELRSSRSRSAAAAAGEKRRNEHMKRRGFMTQPLSGCKACSASSAGRNAARGRQGPLFPSQREPLLTCRSNTHWRADISPYIRLPLPQSSPPAVCILSKVFEISFKDDDTLLLRYGPAARSTAPRLLSDFSRFYLYLFPPYFL